VEFGGENLSAVTPMVGAVEGSTDVVVAQMDLAARLIDGVPGRSLVS